MLFQQIPKYNEEDNAVYEATTPSESVEERFYKVRVILNPLADNKMLLKEDLEEGTIEVSTCTCKGYQNKKVTKCKHLSGYEQWLKDSGVKIDEV